MTRPDPATEALAAQRLAADEAAADHAADHAADEAATDQATTTAPAARRTTVSLRTAWADFWRHPSPPMIATLLAAAVVARVLTNALDDAGSRWWEVLVPFALLAALPLVEWVVHVVVLHWRPRRLGPVTIDSLLAREHRAHHADPRDVPLVFVPWRALLWLLPAGVAVAFLVMPTTATALTLLVANTAILLGYEWTHYLVHSDYRPRSRAYRAVWRNHRLHHYKNEHYWFTVTSAGTADRLLGTFPDAADVPTSPTVRKLHARGEGPATITG